MDAIKQIVASRNIKLIEDCAQAHGALYRGRPVGGLGAVAAWSFCQDKIMTTGGEGGMVTCNDDTLWKRMWSSRITGRVLTLCTQLPKNLDFDGSTMVWNELRLTEMQSAIGLVQLGRMDVWQKDGRPTQTPCIST